MRTALYDQHAELGAKFVQFSGWEMPIQYKGIIPEHQAVRQRAGIFDVSHMGRIVVEGNDAEKFLDYLATNKIAGKPNNSATYTVLCHPSGGSVDDVIIYKEDPQHFFVIVNAGNRQKDLDHIQFYAKKYNVRVQDRFSEEGILALQGPKAISIAAKLFPKVSALKPMQFLKTEYEGREIILSGTGYTGAGGIEIYAPIEAITQLWGRLLELGKDVGIEPIGLGARDTLRLEKGYALYGHELGDTIAPTESVSSWTVKFDKQDFLGKQALQQLEGSPEKRVEYGILLIEPGIAREGYEVVRNGDIIGKVTSGTHSPTLNKSIAIILVQSKLQENDEVQVKIRNNFCKAKVVKLPFI